MKKLFLPIVPVFILVLLAGCSTKFNVAAPYKNITVINAYLDMNDTAHYVRVEKAFLDQNKSALTMATTPDSSFYANINVKIKRLNFTDSQVIDTIHLNRVDLGQEGYPKQPGVFFTAPNYAYKFKNVLDPNYIYRIVVTNLATGRSDSAEAPVIDDTQDGNFISSIFTDTATIDFSSTAQNKFYEFFCVYTAPGSFMFENLTSPVVIAQTIIRFNWVDSNYSTQKLVAHSSDYNVGYLNLTPTGNATQIDYQIPNLSLYTALSSGMGSAPANTIRLMDKCDIFVYMGTQDFVSYQLNSLIQGVGLTGSEIEPVYTNVKGTDVLGLFTSRGMRQGQLKLSDITMDSLINGQQTKINNIKGRVN